MPLTATLDVIDLTIERLGDQGDGVAEVAGGALFVAGALPGERVQARYVETNGREKHAAIQSITIRSPDRIAPACRHFGSCGGCAAQHMSEDLYREWKRSVVVTALERRGFVDAPVGKVESMPAATRRRVRWHVNRPNGPINLGFYARHSNDVVAIAECPVAVPAIQALVAPLRALGAEIPFDEVALTECDNGLDVVVFSSYPLTQRSRETLARFAHGQKLARLSYSTSSNGLEPVSILANPQVAFDGINVEVPALSFLQPSRDGQSALIRFVIEAVGRADPVVDLFAGVGTFALPLARGRRVRAFDIDAAAVAALSAAAANTNGLRIEAQARDLFRRPLSPEALDGYAAVVLDPPRQGAKAQVDALARSRVPLIVVVSCDAGTFARDARALVDGGYAIERVTLIDQFPWTAEIELAAVFRKRVRPRSRTI